MNLTYTVTGLVISTMLFLSVPEHIMAQRNPGPPLPGFVSFWNMRFQINFPNDWGILENLPNTVTFNAPHYAAQVFVNWGSPAPSWILDKSAWIQNMTKQGIIVDRIDNTTTVANNTGLVISFVDNDFKYSVALAKINNLVLDLVYFAPTNNFPMYEDKANTMLSTLQRNENASTAWYDSACSYNTLFTNQGWWSGWQSGKCLNEEGK